MHTYCYFTANTIALCDTQQLDDVPQTLSDSNISGSNTTNTFVIHIAGNDLGPKSNGGQNGCLRSGVKTFDIGCWVTFGKTEMLCF